MSFLVRGAVRDRPRLVLRTQTSRRNDASIILLIFWIYTQAPVSVSVSPGAVWPTFHCCTPAFPGTNVQATRNPYHLSSSTGTACLILYKFNINQLRGVGLGWLSSCYCPKAPPAFCHQTGQSQSGWHSSHLWSWPFHEAWQQQKNTSH